MEPGTQDEQDHSTRWQETLNTEPFAVANGPGTQDEQDHSTRWQERLNAQNQLTISAC